MGPDTEDRLKRITADAAAAAAREAMEHFYNEKMLPVLVRREKQDRSFLRSIWNAIKHGWGVAAAEIDKAMKE